MEEQKKEEKPEVKQQTLGEYRVSSSQPSSSDTVNKINTMAALFIDSCNPKKMHVARETGTLFLKLCATERGAAQNPEAQRCYDLAYAEAKNALASIADVRKAMKDMEAAAMWAVKGATKPEMPKHL